MWRLSYTDEANDDLVEVAVYIANQSSSRDVAIKFTMRIRAKREHLATLSAILGRARPELRHDIRSFPYQGYVIFVRYLGDVLEIVNTLHGSRDIEGFYGGD
jgi:toxin ParE1/3/4